MCMQDTVVSVGTMRYIYVGLMNMELLLRPKLWRRTAPLKKSVTRNVSSSCTQVFTRFLCFLLYIICAFRYHAIHKEVYEWFDISFDKFGRTSTPEQTLVCQAIFNKLFDNNFLSENTMQQVIDFIQCACCYSY